ncbi:MAG: MmcQ/YjbR family DNA-binding protein [Acidobacteriota bacterium]
MKKAAKKSSLTLTGKAAAERRARVITIVDGLPESATVASGNHLSLEVRQKRFGWLLDDHHNDGRLALNCKAPRGVAQQLAAHAPDRFHVPKYVGHLGWIGLWLDTPEVDWPEVKAILMSAYRLTAAKPLIARLDAGEGSR